MSKKEITPKNIKQIQDPFLKIKFSQKVSEKEFKNIKSIFYQYWKVLFILILAYVAAYLTWSKVISFYLTDKNKKHWGKNLAIGVSVVRGLLFSLDGWVTSLLKTPFNQFCYAINKSGLTEEKKNVIINQATQSNEHCKETLKKFGILGIGMEIVAVANFFISGKNVAKEGIEGTWPYLMNISYLIPLLFSGVSIFLVYLELKKIDKEMKFFDK